ncbi:MAG: hypothetical protein ACYDA0_15650 [Candidatus Dormibacteraceae bacterium]
MDLEAVSRAVNDLHGMHESLEQPQPSPFGPIPYSAAAHLFTKQPLCHLSYAGILTEG